MNVLLAVRAAWHAHHTSAWMWFEEREAGSVAISRVTQMDLLRLLTNPKVLPSEVRSVSQAWDAVNEMRSDKRVFFQSEPAQLENIWAALMRDRTFFLDGCLFGGIRPGSRLRDDHFRSRVSRWRELTLRLLV
jgi:uncharacterized protein